VTPEFLEGPIARDYREILEAATTYEAATRQKPGTGGIKCKSGSKGCTVPTGGKDCKTGDCKVPTGGKNCKTGDGCGNVPTGGKNCKTGDGCGNVPTGGKNCKTGDGCGNVPTGGKNCKSDRKICPKAHALPSKVPGWSQPPSQPVA
jgi:hypothetical protein